LWTPMTSLTGQRVPYKGQRSSFASRTGISFRCFWQSRKEPIGPSTGAPWTTLSWVRWPRTRVAITGPEPHPDVGRLSPRRFPRKYTRASTISHSGFDQLVAVILPSTFDARGQAWPNSRRGLPWPERPRRAGLTRGSLFVRRPLADHSHSGQKGRFEVELPASPSWPKALREVPARLLAPSGPAFVACAKENRAAIRTFGAPGSLPTRPVRGVPDSTRSHSSGPI
jgi:hypothetical protein